MVLLIVATQYQDLLFCIAPLLNYTRVHAHTNTYAHILSLLFPTVLPVFPPPPPLVPLPFSLPNMQVHNMSMWLLSSPGFLFFMYICKYICIYIIHMYIYIHIFMHMCIGAQNVDVSVVQSRLLLFFIYVCTYMYMYQYV